MPDVNVLVYAHRHDDPVHAGYRDWLARVAAGPAPFALSALVAVGFVRVVTNPRIYREPTPTPLALAVVDTLLGLPTCRLLTPGPDHWRLVAELCRRSRATGKRVADAQHAALAIEHGCEFMTRDPDFGAFAGMGLRWQRLVPEAGV